MRSTRLFRGHKLVSGFWLTLCLMVLFVYPQAWAAQSSSTSYQVNEVFFGSGGDLHDCSANYCAKLSAGELGVGNTASTSYQAQAGFTTDRSPFIECIVNATTIDLGTLVAGTTQTATATFSVKNYLSNGYVVRTVSDPPTNGSYSMTALGSQVASNSGTEQFGINLAANTLPTTFGANPTQSPDSSFGFGTAASGYDTANVYKYVKGDTVAQSLKSSGTTNFTISYIFNTTLLTPGGQYVMNHVLVATATY